MIFTDGFETKHTKLPEIKSRNYFENWFTKSDHQRPVVYFPLIYKEAVWFKTDQFKVTIIMAAAATQQRTSANLNRALYNFSRERDEHKRQTLLNAGLSEIIKWFSLAAPKITDGKMKLPRQTQRFMHRHQNDVRKLASAIIDPETKRSIILKPGGGGFLSGVIIRSLIRWDRNKLVRRKRTTPKKKEN